MNYKVVPTPAFERELKTLSKKYSSLKNEITILHEQLLTEPHIGIPIGNNCFKDKVSNKVKRQR